MKIRMLGLIAFGALVTLTSNVQASYVTNGNFTTENPPITGSYMTYSVGSTNITGWTVISGTQDSGSGSVDVVNTTFFNSFGTQPVPGGGYAVDLDGTGSVAAGGITQSGINLTLGDQYSLTFYYTINPGASTAASAKFSLGSETGTVNVAVGTTSYTEATLTFTANSVDVASGVLTFQSTDAASDQFGVVIANVSIADMSVPEPASCAMLGMGLLAVGAYARTRRRTA